MLERGTPDVPKCLGLYMDRLQREVVRQKDETITECHRLLGHVRKPTYTHPENKNKSVE
jgi:hypothetical protein